MQQRSGSSRTSFSGSSHRPRLSFWGLWLLLMVGCTLPSPPPPVPMVPPAPSPTPHSIRQSLTIAGYSSALGGMPAAAAVDGDLSTFWATSRETVGAYLEVSLPVTTTMTQLRLHGLPPRGNRIAAADLIFSDGTQQEIMLADSATWQTVALRPVATRSIRLIVRQVTDPLRIANIVLVELEAYGWPTTP